MSTEKPVTIAHLEIDDVKRVKAVRMTPSPQGLTVIGGNNTQGKSSVLDAIMAALLGEKFAPSSPVRHGAEKGEVRVTLSNGICVERRFTAAGSYLKVADPDGKKAGQTLLNGLLGEMALNLGAFMRADDKKKAATLLQVLGINLQPYEERLRKLEQDRLLKGRERDKAKGHAESLPYHEDVGDEPLDGSAMVARMEKALQHNAKVREAKDQAEMLRFKLQKAKQRVAELRDLLAKAEAEERELGYRAALADSAAIAAEPLDTDSLKSELADVDAHNAKVRDNQRRAGAFADMEALGEEYRAMSAEIDAMRAEMLALLDGGKLPLPELSIEDGALVYRGRAWDCMSGAERLRVATAVCHLVNPKCGFALLDGLEAMDAPTLREFGEWLEARGLQAIGTRVGTGVECSIIIEDGVAVE